MNVHLKYAQLALTQGHRDVAITHLIIALGLARTMPTTIRNRMKRGQIAHALQSLGAL